MFIVIKDGNIFKRLILEKTKLPYKYANIEIIKQDNDYYLVLKRGLRFLNNETTKRIKRRKYKIYNTNFLIVLEIYVYDNDEGFNDYHLYENKSFIYAKSNKANIINEDEYLSDIYLYLKENIIETNYPDLLLNNHFYSGEELNDGDKISLHNFIFFYYKDFLYINSFKNKNNIKRIELGEKIIKYENNRPLTNNYYLSKRKELEIPKIKEYSKIHATKQKKLVYQIGPSITMSLAMLSIALINVYNNYLNDAPIQNSLIYLLMPLTMLISGVMWPIISSTSEKKENRNLIKDNKNRYLDYLKKYAIDLDSKISAYLKQEEKLFFNGEIEQDKLFNITDKNDQFLNISIGHITSKYDIEIKEYDDKDIDEALRRIKYRLLNVENTPYFLDIKRYARITILANKKAKELLAKKFLLELSSKYYYDDFYLAIYSEDLYTYKDFFGLPQLFFNNNRLTLNKKIEVQELNSIKFEKPIILFACDHLDFEINNSLLKIIYFTSEKNDIYKDSDVLIEYDNENSYIYEEDKKQFKYKLEDINFTSACHLISTYQENKAIEDNVSFKNIFDDFDIKNNYIQKQEGLKAKFAFVGNELLNFDLHESKSGPHGLIGGSTGSGKSELIISLILSLAIVYRPDYLNVILIDYKGGGIEESLSYMNKRLPHIIASVNNLESDIFERLIVSIDFECKKRQKLFKELSNKAMTSIMNIDDYIDNNSAEYNLPYIAHLLIVVDEFAELKKENPEFIKNLISFSRIGRSLGLHLILATQKPSGIIDEEIWSNSHFKIALKVLTEKDSNDIIKSKSAAYLHKAGEFYLAIDDNLLKGKAIYSKNDVNNKSTYEVSLLDNRLNIINKKVLKKNTPFTEASYIVNKINSACEDLKIKKEFLDFNKPKPLTLMDIKEKYHIDSKIILGEIDDYLNDLKNVLFLNDKENAFIYSNRKEINNILNSLNKQTIVIGFKHYTNKYISDSLLFEDSEDIIYLFKSLMKENKDINLIIEDLSCLLSYDDIYSSCIFQLLARSIVGGIRIIAISKQSTISFKLLNSFKNKYVININDNQDLMNIFAERSAYKGDSFYYDEHLIPFVPCLIEDFIQEESIYKPYIKHIPNNIKYERINNKILIGYSLIKREKIYITDKEKIIISSYDDEILEKLKRIYKDNKNIEVLKYIEALNNKNNYHYLWVGDGLYSQRLFYIDGKEELNDNEAFYLRNNKGEKIRIVEYE